MKTPSRLVLLLLLATGCHRGHPAGESVGEGELPKPAVSIVVRGHLVAGRPVPYRLSLKNGTQDVIVPISAEAETGRGAASWSRSIVGEVRYDDAADRYLENPIARRSGAVLYRSALQPDEELIEDFEVRYSKTGPVTERFTLRFHRLSPREFKERVYVTTGDTMPRTFEPVGLVRDPSARLGALLAGFYLRPARPPESVVGTVEVELPAPPEAIAKRIADLGFAPEKVISADWAGNGWIAGDEEHSLLVGATGSGAKMLPGVPYSAVQVIDQTQGDVPFCVTGASREEVTSLFAGYEVVPHKCLHVSVPREQVLAMLERISASGYAVKPIDFQLREALDVVKRP